ncbi:hypothetical protein RB195_009849 [Necator americanus]|uniref:Uncharacterized protein n=1 Tax=Necator americanus TaxID=51031 RepID=A0ABR1CWH3_NECAM
MTDENKPIDDASMGPKFERDGETSRQQTSRTRSAQRPGHVAHGTSTILHLTLSLTSSNPWLKLTNVPSIFDKRGFGRYDYDALHLTTTGTIVDPGSQGVAP